MSRLLQRFIGILLAVLMCTAFSACKGEEVPEVEKVQLKDLTWGVGGRLPSAEDFAVDLPENTTIRFAEEYTFSEMKEYTLRLIVTLSNGEEEEHAVHLSLVRDTTPPVLEGVSDIVAYIGDGISYRKGVSMRDNCDGEVRLTIDSAAVKADTEGVYPITYTATDIAGNQTVKAVYVYIYRESVTQEKLYELLDPILAEYVSANAGTERKVRDIYNYVYYHIEYDAHSDKSDWVRAAYEGLRTGRGDCFTYFAISKACFERLGIQSKDIQRTPGIVDERHYWNLVNIGSEAAPRWYHFDACRLAGVQHNGCLLTDVQVAAYTKHRVDSVGVGNYFYAYDHSKFPASATEIITPTPSLEPYY